MGIWADLCYLSLKTNYDLTCSNFQSLMNYSDSVYLLVFSLKTRILSQYFQGSKSLHLFFAKMTIRYHLHPTSCLNSSCQSKFYWGICSKSLKLY